MSAIAFTRQATTAMNEDVAAKVRGLVAKHLGVDTERVTNEAHFLDDFHAGWLDRLELMIVIEDQFVGVELSDDIFDQIEDVGDLICFIQSAENGRSGSTAFRSARVFR